MIKTNIILVLIVVLSILGCNENNVEPTVIKINFPLDKPDFISKPEYELIHLILNNQDITFALTQQTNPDLYDHYASIKQEIPEFDSTVYTDYTYNNTMGYYLDSVEILEANIKLISDAEYDYLFNNQDFEYSSWEEFNKWYPKANGINSISRAGFNHDTTRAMIISGFYQESYVYNIIYYYGKTGNTWEIIGQCGIETLEDILSLKYGKERIEKTVFNKQDSKISTFQKPQQQLITQKKQQAITPHLSRLLT